MLTGVPESDDDDGGNTQDKVETCGGGETMTEHMWYGVAGESNSDIFPGFKERSIEDEVSRER